MNKNIRNIYIAMIFITGIFLFAPLIIKLPFVDDIVSWILLSLKQQGYKSSYIEVLGALAGSWLAITGAIYTQRKSEYEKEVKQEEASLKHVESNKILAKVLCQEMLWNEIKSNNYNIKKYHNDPDLDLLKAIKEERTNYHYDGKQNNYHFSNWRLIQNRIIDLDINCAISIMALYKYYEFLDDFNGSANVIKNRSQLDYSKYDELYKNVTDYLKISN